MLEVNAKAEDATQLVIKQAVIYDNMNVGSDMLKVRVLPDMVGYAEEDLPNYSMFNPTTVIKGVAEKDTGSIDQSTKVWIVCTKDYQVGWVLFEANDQFSTVSNTVSNPWGFNKFKEHLLRCHVNTDSINYSELKVLFNNSKLVNLYENAGIGNSDNPATTGLDIVNVRTGERYFMLQSGTTFAFTKDSIYMRVGSPDQDSSFFRMTAGSIEMTSKQIAIYGREKTSIGKHGMYVAGMLGAPTAVDGSPLVPLSDITC